MEKGELRSTYRLKLSELPRYVREQYTYQILELLCNHDLWKKAQTIGITISRYPEIETKWIIERAWKEKKKIVIPKCIPHSKLMDFYEYNSDTIVESVYSGLKEPRADKGQKEESGNIDLMVVPGLCYSKAGYRVGFGGGYYDRYLASFRGIKISLAFKMQIRERIQSENYDIPVDYLFTEQGVITCD